MQKEIRWALQYGKPIIILFEKEGHRPGYFDYGTPLPPPLPRRR